MNVCLIHVIPLELKNAWTLITNSYANVAPDTLENFVKVNPNLNFLFMISIFVSDLIVNIEYFIHRKH